MDVVEGDKHINLISIKKKILLASIAIIGILLLFTYHKSFIGLYELSKAVFSTPMVFPYHDEVERAAYRRIKGDASENPLLEMVHGYLSAQYATNRLNKSDWKMIKSQNGTILIHKKFMEIESKNSFQDKQIKYSDDLLSKYLGGYIESKKLYSQIQNQISSDEISSTFFSRNLFTPNNTVLLAIPSYTDDPDLWNKILPYELFSKTISPWVVLHESGIILASKDANHDFISQINEYKKGSPNLSEKEIISRMSGHEGSHGDIEAQITYTLRLNEVNPVYEGIPGAISKQGDCKGIKRDIIFNEFRDMPSITKNGIRADVGYDKGACFWTILYKIEKKDNERTDDVWAKLLEVSLQTSRRLTESDPHFFTKSEDDRLSLYFKTLITQLGISGE